MREGTPDNGQLRLNLPEVVLQLNFTQTVKIDTHFPRLQVNQNLVGGDRIRKDVRLRSSGRPGLLQERNVLKDAADGVARLDLVIGGRSKATEVGDRLAIPGEIDFPDRGPRLKRYDDVHLVLRPARPG